VYEIKADMNAITSKQEKAAGRSATEKLNEAGFDTQQALVYHYQVLHSIIPIV
jgi:hypothetical protein